MLPVVRGLAAEGVVVSIDTMRAVGGRSRARGRAPPGQRRQRRPGRRRRWRAVVADARSPYVAMHWRGHSADMDSRAVYDDVVTEVRRRAARPAGRAVGGGRRPRPGRRRPGPRLRQGRRAQLVAAGPPRPSCDVLGRPVLVGASRKGFLGRLLAGPRRGARGRRRSARTRPPRSRCSPRPHGAWAVRVHEARATRDAVEVVAAVASAPHDGWAAP